MVLSSRTVWRLCYAWSCSPLRRQFHAFVAGMGFEGRSSAAIKVVAEAGTAYDRLLAPGNAAGEALIQAAIDALVARTRDIERAVAALDLQPIPHPARPRLSPHGSATHAVAWDNHLVPVGASARNLDDSRRDYYRS